MVKYGSFGTYSMWLRALTLMLVLGLATPAVSRARPPHPSMIRPPLQVQGSDHRFWARHVPGDGSCLFHALGEALLQCSH